MKTIKEILDLSTRYLADVGIEDARYSAESIIAFVLGCKRLDIYLDFNKPLLEEELAKIRLLIKRRRKKEPLIYILGSTQFYNCELKITDKVLIPRPETEQLVQLVCNNLKNEILANENLKNKNLWDIGCGSGGIAIALKKEFPDLNVVASDISKQALFVAYDNAKKNDVIIDFRQGDFLDPFIGEKADFVICNPPYISYTEYEKLSAEVKDFEPALALLAKKEGLEFYQRFSKYLFPFLNAQAKVFFEMGYMQAGLVEKEFYSKRWVSKKVYKDLSNKERFFFLEIE